MAFKLKASSPLTIKIDEKLKFKEFDPIDPSKKVKYSTNPFIKQGLRTYEKDAAQLKSEPYKFGSRNSYATISANKRIESFTKRGGMSPGSIKSTLEGRAGMAADTKARKDKTGMYDPKNTTPKDNTPKDDTPKNNKSKKVSFKSAYAERDMKIYKNLDQAEFTAESKRQIASKKAGKGYDAPKKQMGKTPVVKPVKTQKGGTSFMGAGKPQKDTTKTVKSKTVTTAPKETSKRASKLRAKGVAILADKKLSTRKKQKQARSVRKQYDAEMAKNKKKKPVVKAKKKVVEVVAK